VAALQDRPEVPDVVVELRVMLVGFSVHAGPIVGDVEAPRVTVPVNPFRPLDVIVLLLVEPVCTDTDDGLAAMPKSAIVNVIVVVWLRVPRVPLTLTA